MNLLNKITGGLILLLVLLVNNSNAQVVKAFAQRSSIYSPSKLIYSIQGDYSMLGNTNLTVDPYGNFTNNSQNNMVYIDVDGDPNTFNSSSATLQLSTENGAVPECSNIIYAGLYWTGRASTSSSPEEFTVTKGGVTKTFNKRKVQFKGPGATNYTELVANPGNIYYPDGTYGNMYSAYIEVTDYVNTHGIGEYTLADMALIEGNGGPTGYYGGWGMIVVYENSVMKWRDITVFDGHAYVQGNATVNYELPVSGFQTAQSGPINMKLGLMAGEGDVGISGDYFQIRDWQDNNWITLNHSGNSTSNFFNSSVETGGNPRNPSLQNNTGLDISSFNINNPGNTVITNGQTSTRFRYGSTQDTYVIFCIAMAVDAYIPDVEAVVSTEFINGQPVGSGSISAEPGEIIDYNLEIKNKGTEAIDNTVITIPVPYNTSFVPASIGTQINFTPNPNPNNAYFDPLLGPTGSIVWDMGTLPLPPVGNPDSVLAELSFQLLVTSDCNLLTNPDCPPQVVLNGGTTTGVGAVSGSSFDLPFIQGFEDAAPCLGQPITDPLIVDIDAGQYITDNCSGTLSTREFVFCDFDDAILPYDSIAQHFPPGLSFYDENNVTPTSTQYDESNPFPATPGTSTYFAIPDNINFCYYTFQITIQDSILTSTAVSSQESCPGFSDGEIQLSVFSGTSPFTFDWSGPSGFTSGSEDISSLQPGTYDVLITDDIGCTANTSATVTTIPDNTNPSVSCIGAQTVPSDAGICSYSHSGIAWDATISDNCSIDNFSYTLSGATTGTGTTLNGVVFNVGNTTVLWEAEDVSGNTSSCSFVVTVEDDQDPIISDCGVLGSQTVVADAGDCTYENTGTGWDVVATDNCTTISVGYALTGATTGTGTTLDGVVFNNGTTTVTWTVTDAASNVSACTYDIVVEDDQDPIISDCGVSGSQTVVADAGVCTYTNTGTGWDVVATDNCTTITIGYALTGATTGIGTTLDGVVFNNGTTTVTWTVTDDASNVSTCTYDIVVEDDQDPIISDCGVSGSQTVVADAGVCTYTNTGTGWDVVATDNCTTISVGYALTGATTGTGTTLDGVIFNEGTTTVTWTVTDDASNVSTCNYDIVVEDDQDPIISGCPSNVTVTNDLGVCGAVVNWTAPAATDNCGINTFTSTANSGDVFPTGTTTVTYTATDDAGNSITCSFDITVTDNESPVITGCPSNITVSNDAGDCGAVVTWAIPTANDNCGVNSFTSTNNNGDVFAVGTTTVTYTAVDAAGNSTTCSFDVVVEDNENPTILCQPDVTVDAELGVCEADASGVNLGTPVTGDNCGVATVTNNAPANYPVGTTIVTWTVTDVHGNTTTCTQNVDVEDVQAPIISDCGVIGSQTVVADAGVCTYTNIGTGWDVVATDNCTTITVGYALTGATTGTGTTLDGVVFNNGTTTVTWTVTDAASNVSTCTYDIVVEDDQDPIISDCGVSGSQTVVADAGVCTHTNTGTGWDVVVTDNCTTITVGYALTGATTGTGTTLDGVVFNNGTTTVTWTVTDAASNVSTCTYDIVVEDDQDPIISDCGVSGSQTVVADAGLCTYTNTGTGWDVVATDNCTTISVGYVLTGATTGTGTSLDGVVFNNGTTTVTWTVTDDASNVSTCTYDIVVEDDQDPIISDCGVSGSQTVVADAGGCTYTNIGTGFDAIATDNCTIISVGYALTGATTGTGTTLDGVTFNNGTTTVTWTVTDDAGNTSTCTYDIIIEDTELPIISDCGVIGSQTVVADAGVCTYTNTGTGWDVVATDNCATISVGYALTGATTGTGTSLDGVTFNTGTTTVTWTVTDNAGNESTCTFDVVVTDDQLPAISSCGATGTQNVVSDGGVCTYTNSGSGWDATATDNCTVSTIEYALTGATTGAGTTLDGVVFNLGTTTVTWTVTDGSGNESTCTFDVVVTDDQLPAISSCGPSGNQTVNANFGTCTYTYSGTGWNALATDNCSVSSIVYTLSGATTGTGTTLNGVSFNLGVTNVLWTVTDGSGNTSTCSFTVTVIDDQLPSILSCGAAGTQNVSTDAGVCTFTNSGTGWDATATDNCNIASINYVLTGATTGTGTTLDGVTFAQGVTSVTWTATDGSGNTVTCNYEVVVTDNEVPVISGCVTDINVNNDNNDCGAIVNWVPPTFTDNCGASMTSTHNPGDFFPVGATTVTYTVTDNAGNVSICSFNVTVTDNELPQMTCNTNIASCDSFVVFNAPTVTDNCGIVSVTQTAGLPSGSVFPVGTTAVIFEALDIHGNINTCSFDVTIYPTPVLTSVSTDVTCNGLGDGEIDLTVSSGTAPFTYNWTNGSTSQDVTNLQPGVYGVTVTDAFGCSAEINDTIAQPNQLLLNKEVDNVSCYDGTNGTIDITISGGTLPYTYLWSNGSTSEDLSGITVGSYSVVVMDANGCEVSDITNITQPDSIQIQSVVNNATCNASNGSINTQVTGGVSPYDYLWSNGSTAANLTNVVGGTYTLTVTDGNGCVSTLTDSVGTTSNIAGFVYTTDVLCYGGTSGTALVFIEAGNTPFTYSWSTGDTTNLIEGLSAGSYSVYVQDAFGCDMTLNFDVEQPDELEVELYSPEPLNGYNVSLYGGSDGSIQSDVYGGTGEITYVWSNGSTTPDINGLTAGFYSVIVTDANGCSANANISLNSPRILDMPEGLSPNGDGDNDYFVIKGIEAYPNNELTIYNRWGNIVYQRSGYSNEWQGENNMGEPLPDGTYFAIFKPSGSGNVEPLTGYVDLRRSR